MIKIKNMIKILSLLLCLGFVFNATDAFASDPKDFDNILKDYAKFKEKYGTDCAQVDTANLNFERKYATLSQYESELESIQSQIGSLCNKYSGNSKDYKACTSGGKVSTDSLDETGSKTRIEKVKELKTKESSVNQKISAYKQELNKYVSKAKSALKQCESNAKKSNKADKSSEKADEKAKKAQEKADQANKDYNDANAAYENCMKSAYGSDYKSAGKDNDPNNKCSKEYNKLAKAYDKYQDKQEKADDKKDTADAKKQAAKDAEQQQLNGQCTSPLVWNANINGCAPSSKWSKAQYDSMYKERYEQCLSKLNSRGTDPLSGKKIYIKSEKDACIKQSAQQANEIINFANSCAQEGSDDELCDNVAKCLEANPTSTVSECKGNAGGEEGAGEGAGEGEGEGALNADGTALGGTNNMGTMGDLNNKAIECQKLTGSAQDACWDEYDAMASKAEKEGKSPVIEGKYLCPAIDGKTVTIFDYLACRITGVVRELRIIVYILAGFGMIAFAYGAIIGKISWKQLSNIAIGLFILSMTTSFIEYVTGASRGDASLKYGNHLPDGNHHQFKQSKSDCSTDPSLCPGASGSALDMLKGEAESGSWSWSDLKASIGSVKNAVRTAAKAYSTVKNTVDTVSTAVQGISSAIKNGGNIVDVVMNVADNVNTALKSVNNAGNSLAMSASSISNDLADAGSTAAQREYKDALRSEYQALKKKCEQGIKGCSENEKKALAQLEQDLNDNTTGTDKWLNSTGSNILSALGKASDKANDAENKARDVKANQAEGKAIGNKIGGSGLGNALGAAMAIGTAIENSSGGKKK